MSKESLQPTPGQTVGPFFHYGMQYERGNEVSPPWDPNTVILSGIVTDGNGDPIIDCQLEIWQPDHTGTIPQKRGSFKRDGHSFTGFGRTATSEEGYYEFFTQNPGVVAERTTNSAPFISMIVYARGLLNKLHTRVYLPDDAEALANDDFLKTLTEEERKTLIATRLPDGSLKHDIRLQGESETVFIAFNG